MVALRCGQQMSYVLSIQDPDWTGSIDWYPHYRGFFNNFINWLNVGSLFLRNIALACNLTRWLMLCLNNFGSIESVDYTKPQNRNLRLTLFLFIVFQFVLIAFHIAYYPILSTYLQISEIVILEYVFIFTYFYIYYSVRKQIQLQTYGIDSDQAKAIQNSSDEVFLFFIAICQLLFVESLHSILLLANVFHRSSRISAYIFLFREF